MLTILKQCERELMEWPEDVRGDLADAIARLERGHLLSMPLSRPMPSIGRGVHELRLRDSSGVFRVVYWLAGAGAIWLVHAFEKKSQATPIRAIETARERLKRIRP